MSTVPPPRPDLLPPEESHGQRPREVPWGPLDAVPVFVLAIILSFIGSVPAVLLLSADGSRFVWIALVGEVGFLGAVVIWLRVVRRVPLGALGAPREPLRDLGVGLLSGGGLVVVGWIAGIVVVVVARLILGHAPVQPEQIPLSVQGPSLLLSGIVVVVAAPIGEEVFFRGFLFQGLRRRLSLWPAALISAAVFAVVHWSPILIFALFPIGVGLALVFEHRRSLLSSIAAHAVFNLVGILVIVATR
jgi:membrane protease YdiL (CAAX protease family)